MFKYQAAGDFQELTVDTIERGQPHLGPTRYASLVMEFLLPDIVMIDRKPKRKP